MPSLSLCMIVRNEAGLLPEFIAAVAGLYDQWVAVDTGSSDGTVALLEQAGAEVHRLPWQDDFALARNESLRHARGDWILVLDADEFPRAGFSDEVRALIGRDKIGAANITRHDEQKNGIVRIGTPLRLFRNDPSIRYRYRIHEDVSASVIALLARTGREFAQLATPVRHVGYLPAQLHSRDKQARDERLLKLALADDPEDLYSRFKLLEQYRFWGRESDMGPVAAECRALIQRGIPIHPAHIAGDLADMVRQGLFPNDITAGIEFLCSAAGFAAHTGHYHVALGSLYEQGRQAQSAFSHFARALQLLAGDPARRLVETRALTGLTRLSMAIADWGSAREFAEAAARLAPDDPEVRMALDFLARQPR